MVKKASPKRERPAKKVNARKKAPSLVNDKHFRVAVYGSARTKPSQKAYKLVQSLSKMIAKEGMDVVTGGGPGLMDAASKGHHEGNKNHENHSIGLTIYLPKEQVDGYHLDIKKDFKKFSKRLDTFMQYSNVFVVAPGGIGTVLELFYTWQLMQVKHTCNVPIILLGEMWFPLVDWIREQLLENKLVNKEDLDMVYCVRTCSEAMVIIRQVKAAFDKGGKNFCLNYHKYKA